MYPSNHVIDWKLTDGHKHLLLINVYVDDLTLCGNQACHSDVWAKLRETVKLEDEVFIDGKRGTLILGRKHFIDVEDKQAAFTFDMKPYAESVVGQIVNWQDSTEPGSVMWPRHIFLKVALLTKIYPLKECSAQMRLAPWWDYYFGYPGCLAQIFRL